MNILKENLDFNFIKKWQEKGFDPIVLSILNRRNIISEKNIISIFYSEFELLDSPFLYKLICKAYQRIERAIQSKEKIIVFGDRDVDGTTSISIIVDFLKQLGAKVDWDVPTGIDNYGLSMDKINKWIGTYNLCITVDCGITNILEIEQLKNNGIDTIILDHHSPLQKLPDCYAIINPKCEDSISFKNIAAAGVVFLFVYGYLFYKSKFYNKNILFLYYDKNRLKFSIYKNIILIKNGEINNINFSCFEKIDIVFYDFNNINIKNYIFKFFNKECYNLKNIPYLKKLNLDIAENIIFLKSLLELIPEIENVKAKYLILSSLGTIADVMPLIDTNRIFVSNGLKYLNNFDNLTELCKKVEVDPTNITAKDLSWKVCPLLNASGRMGDATITVLFLMDRGNHNFYIQAILDNNKERKSHEEFAFNMFKEECDSNKNFYNNNVAFFYSDKIHKGITGIAAAKLAAKTNCPTIVAAKEGDFYIGSIRGKCNYHFVEFLDNGKEILLEYGGHQSAAGFRFHQNNLNDFIEFLKKNSNKLKKETEDHTIPIKIDAEIPIEYLNYDLFRSIFILEPFGEGNQNPILWTREIKINNYLYLGKDKQHIKIYFDTEPTPIIGILWNKADLFKKIYSEKKRYNILYQLELNKFNNEIIPQLIILDIENSD